MIVVKQKFPLQTGSREIDSRRASPVNARELRCIYVVNFALPYIRRHLIRI